MNFKIILFIHCLIFMPLFSQEIDWGPVRSLPVAYQGRFRPMEAYARLWLENVYGAQQLDKKTLESLGWQDPSALNLLFQIHFKGYESFAHITFGNKIDAALKMVPVKRQPGEWVSLKELKLNQKNFTSFSDEEFENLRNAYLELEKSFEDNNIKYFGAVYQKAYAKLQPLPYRSIHNHKFYYPSDSRLRAETIYYQYPLFEICLIAYVLSFLLFIISPWKTLSLFSFIAAFLFHTLFLSLRIYILQRPPVSNMFETIIYVPWIAVLTSLSLGFYYKNKAIYMAANVVCLMLLTILKIGHMSGNLDTIQPVLNSQYWLIVHVLLVVGSYGLFFLGGILGHLYLILYCFYPNKKELAKLLEKFIPQSIYIGLTLLIAGTLLGGVWAAESWGRFWDWDPKESWAFISISIYLIWIHAYMFKLIGEFGLAIGSIVGLLAISFTWYGVNYILGTGLHSYGFGSGGNYFYYLLLIGEALFLLTVLGIHYKRKKISNV